MYNSAQVWRIFLKIPSKCIPIQQFIFILHFRWIHHRLFERKYITWWPSFSRMDRVKMQPQHSEKTWNHMNSFHPDMTGREAVTEKLFGTWRMSLDSFLMNFCYKSASICAQGSIPVLRLSDQCFRKAKKVVAPWPLRRSVISCKNLLHIKLASWTSRINPYGIHN